MILASHRAAARLTYYQLAWNKDFLQWHFRFCIDKG